jgi:hypothetical protein
MQRLEVFQGGSQRLAKGPLRGPGDRWDQNFATQEETLCPIGE